MVKVGGCQFIKKKTTAEKKFKSNETARKLKKDEPSLTSMC